MSSPTIPSLDASLSDVWYRYFTQMHQLTSTISNSGLTANRPTDNLWIGQQYFDTTINKPVYLKSVRPNVWVDAAGATV